MAGVRALRSRRVIADGERVVAVLTGHLLKDPEIVVRYHQETEPHAAGANRPVEIEASLAAVERVMRRA